VTFLVTSVTRSGRVESIHRGVAVAVAPNGEELVRYGDADRATFVRSSAKPFQGMAILRSGAYERFQFSDREMAVMCASHNAEKIHVETVRGILEKIGLSEDDFACGAHPPIDKNSARELLRRDHEPTQIHNNCSGKHSGMLATALALGASPKHYLDQTHPVQQLIHSIVCEYTDETDIFRGVDGCSAPVFWLPLKKLALAFARLASQETEEQCIIFRVMNGNPYLVAGKKRLDTQFMEQFPGALVSKGGGEAVYGAALAGVRRPAGIAVKVLDGNARALGPMILRVLEDLGALEDGQKEALAWFWKPELKNVIGKIIGSYQLSVED